MFHVLSQKFKTASIPEVKATSSKQNNYIYYHIYHVLCNKCFNVVCITYVYL